MLWGGECSEPAPAGQGPIADRRPAPDGAASEVCPRVTLHQDYRASPRAGEARMATRARVDLDLPAPRQDDPLPLVHFVMGVAFRGRARAPSRRAEWRLAARFYRWAADGIDRRAPHREILELYAAIAAVEIGDADAALDLCGGGLDRVRGTGTLFEPLLVGCVAEGLKAKSDLDGALAAQRHALVLGERLHDVFVVGTAYCAIGEILTGRGDPAAALDPLERALALFTKAGGEDSAEAGMAEDLLARAYAARRDVDRALEHGRRALAIAEQAYGPTHETIATFAFFVGSALEEKGDAAGALSYARRAAAVIESSGAGALPLAGLVENLTGTALRMQHEPAQAKEHFRKALAILTAARGPGHREVAAVEHNLGSLLNEQGDYAGSLEHLLPALEIREKLFGPESEQIVEDLAAIASTRFKSGDLAGALAVLNRARRIADEKLGDQSVVSLQLCAQIGAALLDQGRFAEARDFCRFAYPGLDAALGADSPPTQAAAACVAYAVVSLSGWKPGAQGVIVVRPRSRRAGLLRPGDWISTYEGKRVRDAAHLAELSAKTPPDDIVHLTVVRDKKQVRVPACGGPMEIDAR